MSNAVGDVAFKFVVALAFVDVAVAVAGAIVEVIIVREKAGDSLVSMFARGTGGFKTREKKENAIEFL